jgi:hypothetical protein
MKYKVKKKKTLSQVHGKVTPQNTHHPRPSQKVASAKISAQKKLRLIIKN